MIDLTPYTDSNGDIDLKKELIQNLAGIITDSGSNENGRYVRFSDGTQICFGAIPYSGSLTRTFPAAFSAVPHIVTDMIGPNDVAMLSKVYSRTTSSFAIRRFQFAAGTWSPAEEQVAWIAIGRWK